MTGKDIITRVAEAAKNSPYCGIAARNAERFFVSRTDFVRRMNERTWADNIERAVKALRYTLIDTGDSK